MFARTMVLCCALAGAVASQGHVRIGDEGVRELVDKLIPVVEKHAGRKFRERPRVLIADAREVSEALTEDFVVQFRSIYAGLDEATVRTMAVRQAQAMGQLLGKYGFESGVLYVIPENVKPFAASVGAKEGHAMAIFEVVLAHELTHALQDQHVGLAARLRGLRDQDRIQSMNARLEGHAVFVEDLCAEELGLMAGAHIMRKVFEGRADLGAATRLTAFRLRASRMNTRMYYVVGAQRMEEWFEAGGHDRQWRELAAEAPPSRAVFRHALDPDPQPIEEFDGVLDGMAEFLCRGRWPVARGVFGEAILRSENSHVADDLDEVLTGFRGAAFCETHAPNPALLASIYAMAFADASLAERFVGLAEKSAVVDGEALDVSGGRNPLARHEVRDIPAPDGASGRQYSQSPRPRGFGVAVRGSVSWLQRGRFVVQVSCFGIVLTDEQILAMANTVFERLEQR